MKCYVSYFIFLGTFLSFNGYADFIHNSKTGAITPHNNARVKVELGGKDTNPNPKGFFKSFALKLVRLSKDKLSQPIEIRKAIPAVPIEIRKAIVVGQQRVTTRSTLNTEQRRSNEPREERVRSQNPKSEEKIKSLLIPAELKKAVDFVNDRPELIEEVAKKTQETTLKDSQEALNRENISNRNTGYVQTSGARSNSNSQGLVFDEQEANLSYQIALVYLRNQLLEQQLRSEARAEKNDDTLNASKIAMQSALEKALNDPFGIGVATPNLDAESLGKSYLDLAANQLSLGLLNDYTNDSEFNDLIQNALKASNSLDLDKSKLGDQLKPFQSLINSSNFSEKSAQYLGKENASALVSSIQAAELINEYSNVLNSNALQFLGSAFSLGTSMAPPPCVGCINDSTKDFANSLEASQKMLSSTNEWIEEAYTITNRSVNNANPKDNTANGVLMRGRIELEKLIATLKLYNSSGLLNLVSDPQSISMSLHYKNAVESAAQALFRVKQRKDKENPDIQVLANSADTLLKKMTLIKKPQEMEQTLRDFFEVSKNNYIRHLWRSHEPKRYTLIKQATAQIIVSRKLSLLNAPSFDKATQEKAALAFLIRQAFQSLNVRKQRELEQRQLQLGLKQLAPIEMANEKKNTDTSSNNALKSEILDLPDPARFPSLSEEESVDISF